MSSSCSPDGKFVVYQAVSQAPARIMKVGIDGGTPVPIGKEHLESPVISPDGRSIAASYEPGPDQPARVAVVGVESGEVQNIYSLPQGAALGHQAGERVTWTKDGRSILFAVNKNGISNVWAQTVVPPGRMATAPADHQFLVGYDLVVCAISRRKRNDFRPRASRRGYGSHFAHSH